MKQFFKSKKFVIVSVLFLTMFCLFSLVGCKKDEEEKTIVKEEVAEVSVDSIKYDGQTLNWGVVNHADGYEIKYGENTVSSETNSLEVTVSEDVKFEIRATVKSDNEYYLSCSTFVGKDFYYKGQIAITRENRTVSWEPVEGCLGYKICENDSMYQGYQQETAYKLVSKQMENGNGSIKFKVKAVFEEENYFTVWSEELNLVVLATPSEITFDGNILTWNKVADATSYTIIIRSVDDEGKEVIKSTEEITNTSYVYNAIGDDDGTEGARSAVLEGSFSFSVISNSTIANVISSDEGRFSFTYVNPISEITMIDGYLTWPKVANADYYLIESNGTVLAEKVLDNTYSCETVGGYTIRVTPRRYDGSLYSNWSARQTFNFLDAPCLQWISGADSYSLDWQKKENGELYNSTGCSFEVIIENVDTGQREALTSNSTSTSGETLLKKFTKGSVYAVYVKAYKSGVSEMNSSSLLSKPIYFYNVDDPSGYNVSTKDVYETDLYTTLYINDIQIRDDFKDYGFTVKYRAGINSNGGDFNSDSAVSSSTERQITIPESVLTLSSQSFNIAFKAESEQNKKQLVNSNGDKCVFVLSSDVKEITVERLSYPTLSMLNSFVTWDRDSKASSYQVKIMKDGQIVKTDVTYAIKYNIVAADLESGEYTLQVSALGNGNIVLSSKYSNPITFRQLAAPQNLRIVGTEDNRKITWDAITDCNSYTLRIGTAIHDLATNEYSISRDELSVLGTTIGVTATGSTLINAISSKESENITIYKLKTPTNILVNDTQVSWNSVDAYGGKTVGYNLYTDTSTKLNNEIITDTFFNLYDYAELKNSYGIETLSLQVEAVIVDKTQTQFFDSDRSQALNITRLASPSNVRMNKNTGEITWEPNAVNIDSINGYALTINYSNHPSAKQVYYLTDNSFTPTLLSYPGDQIEFTVVSMGNGTGAISSNPYNVSESGVTNVIGCVATLEKLETMPDLSTFATYTVDATNHIIVTIDETKLTNIKAGAYGININGVINVIRRYEALNTPYVLDSNDGLYKYTLDNGSQAIYDAVNSTYSYVSRYSASGNYDIDIKYVGGNFSVDPSTSSDSIVCYISGEYTGNTQRLVILEQFAVNDLSIVTESVAGVTKYYISFGNKSNASSYKYELQYLRMGGYEVGESSGELTIAADNSGTTKIEISIPEGATSVRIKIRAIGDGITIFDSIKECSVDLIFASRE